MSNIFQESEIRPVNHSENQLAAMNHDIAWLQQRKDSFIHVSCPACDSEKKFLKYEKYSFRYDECSDCGTIYMNPRADAQTLGKFSAQSENYNYWNKHIFPVTEKARREKIFVPRVDKVLHFAHEFGSGTSCLLEVGAGFGTFCEEMSSRNVFDCVIAVEPTPGLAQTCRDRGIETIEKPIEEINFPETKQVDVVVNFEVIEHLFSPREFLRQCNRMLRKNGLFVVTCPNGKGFDVVTLGTVSKTIDHEHINYFNPESLSLLLTACGFEILKKETPGVLDVDLVKNAVLNGEFSLETQPFLNEIVMNSTQLADSFQQFLIANGLSSNMWIIAKKKYEC